MTARGDIDAVASIDHNITALMSNYILNHSLSGTVNIHSPYAMGFFCRRREAGVAKSRSWGGKPFSTLQGSVKRLVGQK